MDAFFQKLSTGGMRTMMRCLVYLTMITSLISGCAAFSTYDAGGPASHHAQRKYEEAGRKGLAAPAETGTGDQK
jgi:hypothetical protein